MRNDQNKKFVLNLVYAAIAAGVPLRAAAQEVAAVPSLGKIEVTGTNIKRTEGESGLPVQVMTREELLNGGVQTMQDVLTASAGPMRLSSTLIALFAVVAGLLAYLGIYGVVSYAVAQRTREIGIRVALGANRVSVLRLIVGDGLKMAALGVVAGAAGTWMLVSTIRSLLYEVNPADPAVLMATCGGAFLLAAVASLVPAIRVMQVDPSVALRVE
jgi:ABC-type antimicrobial peptide transport system permease subunit